MALVAAHLNAGVIFWSGGDSVAIGIQPTYQLHPFSPYLISLMVSVDAIQKHVDLLTLGVKMATFAYRHFNSIRPSYLSAGFALHTGLSNST